MPSSAALALLAAAPFSWAVGGGGPGPDDADGIGADRRGGTIISGGFAGTSRFGPGRALTSASRADDIFVAGYDRRGRNRWARRFGATGADHAYDNDVDSRGRGLVTGSFDGVVPFGRTTLTSRGASPLPQYGDAFLLKIGRGGRPLWVRQIGGPASDGGDEVTVGPGDDAFVIGDTAGPVRFGAGIELPATGGRDAWAARYRADGRLAWARSLGGSGDQQSHGIAADGAGNALVTGEFRGPTRLGTTTLDSRGRAPDVFLASLGPGGRVRWASSFGGVARQIGRGVDADARGNVFFAGEFARTITLGSRTLTSAGDDDLFVARADPAGRVAWAISIGGPQAEVGPEIEVDARGNSYLAGSFAGTARFGARTYTASGARAAFVAKVSPAGRILWVRTSGESPFSTLGELTLSPGAVTVLGRFVDRTALGRFRLTAAGRTDFFVARLPAG